MPKHVAAKTRQLSVRVDMTELALIEEIAEASEKQTTIKPQRSDVVRRALGYGLQEYVERHGASIGLSEATIAAFSKPKSDTSAAAPAPEAKKKAKKS